METSNDPNDQPPHFQIGDRVVKATTKDNVGVVVPPGRFRQAARFWYRVQFGPKSEAVLEEDLEAFYEAQDITSLIVGGVYASSAALSRRVTLSKLQSPLRDAVYAMNSSRTQFHPYQFKPLLKFLGSDKSRLLIADEVGLGKTIEAGFILRELKARSDIDRILIVCPASLRNKWQSELNLRFGEKFEIYTAKALRRWIQDDQRSEGRTRIHGIVSIQTIRTQYLHSLIEETPLRLDLLIVDEAHHLRNRETRQHRSVRQLTSSTDAIVFLTATPMHLHNQDLFNLLNLLLPEEFDQMRVFDQRLRINQHIVKAETHLRTSANDKSIKAAQSLQLAASYPDPFQFKESRLFLETVNALGAADSGNLKQIVQLKDDLSRLNLMSHIFTRTKKKEAYPDAAIREPVVFPISFTASERFVYDKIYEFCCEHYSASMGNWAAQFPLITLQRKMSSSIPAMLNHYREILSNEIKLEIDLEDEEDSIETEEHVDPRQSAKLINIRGFKSLIRECLEQTNNSKDSKLTELIKVLQQKPKVVLFSYFRDTLRYLELSLQKEGFQCVRIDGSVPYNPENPDEDERLQRINQFKHDPSIKVLLSSEVGSEGLDFQFCDTLVNWDLPWNPMVVEQRIGRLDRLGQKSKKISIINFSVPNTIEDQILKRLYYRVGLFEGAIGPLEPILGEQIQELTSQLLQPHLTPQQQSALIEQKALALEIRLKEEQNLEAASSSLMGQDEVFNERIDRVRKLGRYVTPLELEIFTRDFLESEFPKCSLRNRLDGPNGKDAGEGCYWYKITPDLKSFVRKHIPRLDDPSLLRFEERADGNLRIITFNPDIAYERPAVEHIHNQHPLVKAISDFYGKNVERIPPVFKLELASDIIPPGVYALLIAEIKEEGLQSGRSIWVEALNVASDFKVTGDIGEELLHSLVTEGVDWDSFAAPPGLDTLPYLEQLSDRVGVRILDRREEAKRQNSARIDSRLGSLKASYQAKRRIREDILNTHKLRDNKRAIPLFEAQIRRTDAEYEEKARQLEAGRMVVVTQTPSGFGFINVIKPREAGQ